MEHQTTDNSPQPEALLLKPREAASALRIGERLLWELTNRGEVPCVRIGRLVRYAPDALKAWIASKGKQSR